MKSKKSPGNIAVSHGSGSVAGAGEQPPKGPGAGARRMIATFVAKPKRGGRK